MATIAQRPGAPSGSSRIVGPAAAKAARYVFAGVRIALGWVFLWAFLDKTFGLGHETAEKAAWINGGHRSTQTSPCPARNGRDRPNHHREAHRDLSP